MGLDEIMKSPAQDVVDQADANASLQEPTGPKDKAIDVLQQSGRSVELTPENNKRVLRIIDLYVLPIILGM